MRFAYVVANTCLHDVGLSFCYLVFYHLFTDGLFERNVQMRVIGLVLNFLGWWWCVDAILPVGDDVGLRILFAVNGGAPLVRTVVFDLAGPFAAWGWNAGFLSAASGFFYLTFWWGGVFTVAMEGKVIGNHGMNFWNDYGLV